MKNLIYFYTLCDLLDLFSIFLRVFSIFWILKKQIYVYTLCDSNAVPDLRFVFFPGSRIFPEFPLILKCFGFL